MMKNLRIIFTILCAVCIAALIPMGMFLGWTGVGYCFFGAIAFFVLMLFCKQSQELKESREQKETQASELGGNDPALAPTDTDHAESEKDSDKKR